MSTGFNETIANRVASVPYMGMNAVDYAKEVKETTDTIPKRETPLLVKETAALFAFGYENSGKIAAAGEKVLKDLDAHVKENAKQNAEKYENSSTAKKCAMGLVGQIVYQFNKWIAE